MSTDFISIAGQINPLGFLGPITDKEMRISSRRKRNYLLRCVYIGLLTLFLSVVWLSIVATGRGSMAYLASRMSEAGMTVTLTVTWLQFILLPAIAIVMLSNSISDEIHKGTLAVLMTTPVNSFQIVTGKMVSKLLQMSMLLATSLPALAIIRVMGGVPWEFVFSGVMITFTTAILAGSVSLLLSAGNRHSYQTIVISVFIMVFFNAFTALTCYEPNIKAAVPDEIDSIFAFFECFSPFVALFSKMSSLKTAVTPATTPCSWPGHCLLSLLLSFGLLLLATLRLRKAMLTQAFGPGHAHGARKWFKLADKKEFVTQRPVKRVKGSAIMWKERQRISPRKMRSYIILAVILGGIYLTGTIFKPILKSRNFHSVFVGILVLWGLIRTAALAANSIAFEKDCRTWQILLATPLENWTIIRDKMLAVIRETTAIWVVLGAHVLFFIGIGVLHPLSVLMLVACIAPSVIFLLGSGMYFGIRMKTATGAVVATFALPIILWFTCPGFGALNPVILSGVAMHIDDNSISRTRIEAVIFMTMMISTPIVAYITTGLIFMWRANCRIRKNIFGLKF